MRDVSSAFWLGLQQENVQIAELIDMDAGTKQFYFTTTNVNIVSSGNTYVPFFGQSASGIEESSDMGVAVTDFTLANTGGILDEVIYGYQLEFADVVIRRVLVNSPDIGQIVTYRGRVGDFAYNRDQITGQARNLWNSADTDWPYMNYQDGCSWRFGSSGCGFDVSSIRVNSVTAVSMSTDRRTLALPSGTLTASQAVGWYEKGRLDIRTGANSGTARGIFSQSGDTIALYASLPSSLTLTDFLTIQPGCRKRLIDDCYSKFNNTSHFLGFPWIPRQENVF